MKKFTSLICLLAVLLFASSAQATVFGFPVDFTNLVAYAPYAIALTGTGALTSPVRASYRYTANNTGYTLTLGETNVHDGQLLCIYNVGSNSFTLANDTGGTTAMPQYTEWCGAYQSDRWITRGTGGISLSGFDTAANYIVTGAWDFNGGIQGQQTGGPYTPTQWFEFEAYNTATSGNKSPITLYSTFDPSANSTGNNFALNVGGEIVSGNTRNTTGITGVYNAVTDSGSGTRTSDIGIYNTLSVSSSHGAFSTNIVGLVNSMDVHGAAVVANMIGIDNSLVYDGTDALTDLYGSKNYITDSGTHDLTGNSFAVNASNFHSGNGNYNGANKSSGGLFAYYQKSGTGTDAYAMGTQSAVYNTGSGTITSGVGTESDCWIGGAGNITTCLSVYGYGGGNGGGDYSSLIMIYADSPVLSAGSTASVAEGLRILDQHPAGTTTSKAINILNQSAGGKAIVTGTGAIEFGDTVTTTVSATSPIFQTNAADPADSGIFRLANAENVCWEASPAGTDVCAGVDSAEVIQITGGKLDGADLSNDTVGPTQIDETAAYALSSATNTLKAASYASGTNCADSAGAAACGSAIAGSFVIDATTTATVVSTTAVTANSQIILQEDSSLGTRLSVTCNTQSSLTLGALRVTARTAATSFTATLEVGPTTNPMCVNYWIIN